MKTIPEGRKAELSILVTEEMTVDFEELGAGHPVYATYWIAKHFEEAGRKLLLPFLQEGDSGIGTEVSVKHTASALPGMQVTITAVAVKTEGRRLYADLRAISELGDVVATGHTVQYIAQGQVLEQGFDKLRQRWDDFSGQAGLVAQQDKEQ